MFLLYDVAGLRRCEADMPIIIAGMVKFWTTRSRSTSLSPPGYHTSEGVIELDRRATERWGEHGADAERREAGERLAIQTYFVVAILVVAVPLATCHSRSPRKAP